MPDQMTQTQRYAISNNTIQEVDPLDIDYEVPSINNYFGTHTSQVPLQNNLPSSRTFYGDRFFNQSVPLVNREAPWVQSLNPDTGESYEKQMGRHMGALYPRGEGVVESVGNGRIVIKTPEGEKQEYEYYDHFPFNRKTGITQTPRVEPGDKVDPDTLLAVSNFTDDQGVTSLGVNARVAVIPWKGYSYEDARVISEDFAERLRSEHMETYQADFKKGVTPGKVNFQNLFPDTFTKNQLSKLDDRGVVKQGAHLEPGDPIMLMTAPRIINSKSLREGDLSKHLRTAVMDRSEVYEGEDPAFVQSVRSTDKGAKVNLSITKPARIGDKIVFRSGDKGIISAIIPSETMPRTRDGESLDMLVNPSGLPSRTNAALILETAFARAAEKEGQPLVLPSFNEEGTDRRQQAEDLLTRLGISPKEKIYDPEAGGLLDGEAAVGNAYIMKLHHTVDSKLSGRGTGLYDQDEQPLKGGEEGMGAKRLSGLETNALISSGAYNVIRGRRNIRGQKRDEFWRNYRAGRTVTEPQGNFAWEKFQNLLIGAGMGAEKLPEGYVRLAPFTDAKLDALKPQELESGDIVDSRTLKPIKGGLFDERLHTKFGKISLPADLPNPAFERNIAKLLGIRGKDIPDILSGDREALGGRSLREALSEIDLDAMKSQALETIKNGKKTHRPLAIDRLGIITGMERTGTRPEDLLITKVPVIPSAFRPYSAMGDTFIPGDANQLYADVFQNKESLQKLREVLGDDEAGKSIGDLYKSVKALYGYGPSPNQKLETRGVSGFMRKILGSSPKTSYFQKRLIGGTADFTTRSTITVDPELDMDQISIPEEKAWELFGPHVQRAWAKQGIPPGKALARIMARDSDSRKLMIEEMKNRPVMYSRAPAWHRFSSLGGWAVLSDGKNIGINPLVTSGLGADFDGDQQINYVVILVPKYLMDKEIAGSENRLLRSVFIPIENANKMNDALIYDTKTHILGTVDLEDFPHGELLNSKQGKNGLIEFFSVPDDVRVIAYDEATGDLALAPVSCWSRHPERLVEVVHLKNKLSITTDDDPRAVYGVPHDTGGIERATPTNALRRKFAVPYAKKLSKVTPVTIEHVDFPGWPGGQMGLTRDTGYWLGAMAGDGWCTKKQRESLSPTSPWQWQFCISDLRGYTALRVQKILSDLLGSDSIEWHRREMRKKDNPDRYGDTVKYTASSPQYGQAVCKFLIQHIGGLRSTTHSGSGSKKLPVFAFTAPREFKLGLLCGLFDTDGSVSVSNGKARPQLMVSMTSTSFKLLRDTQLLLRTLDVRSSITYSKTTTAGNTSWILTVSAPDLKREGVLNDLQVPEKRDNFLNTAVDLEADSLPRYDKVPAPLPIVNKLLAFIGAPKTDARARERVGEEGLRGLLDRSNIALGLYAVKDSGCMTRQFAEQTLEMVRGLLESREALRLKVLGSLAAISESGRTVRITGGFVRDTRKVILDAAPVRGYPGLYKQGQTQYRKLNRVLNRGTISHCMAADIRQWLLDHPVEFMTPELLAWQSWVLNNDIAWEEIDHVDYTGIAEDGYDLTVPGYETFMAVDGVILSNTINVHVPVLQDEIEEIKNRIMPSRMLFSIRDFETVVPQIKQEYLYGLNLAKNRKGRTITVRDREAALKLLDSGAAKANDEFVFSG